MRARRSLRRITEHDLKTSVQYYGAIFCIYDMEGGVAKEKYCRILTTYDLRKFEFKKIMLNNVATTSENGLMSATDKQHLDDVYADYSSALTALGVI